MLALKPGLVNRKEAREIEGQEEALEKPEFLAASGAMVGFLERRLLIMRIQNCHSTTTKALSL